MSRIVCIVVAVVLVVLVYVLQWDEVLDSQVQKLLTDKGTQLIPGKNSYYSMLGFRST